MRRAMRAALALAFTVGLLLVPAAQASAHVHAITPLLKCSVDNTKSGGGRTETTPAWTTNGGPLNGVFPIDVGQSVLEPMSAGFDAPVRCP